MKLGSLIAQWLVPSAWVLGSILFGFVFERIILSRFKEMASKTKMKLDDIVVDSLNGLGTFSFAIFGIYIAVNNSPMRAGWIEHAEKGIFVLCILVLTVAVARLVSGFVNTYSKILPSTTIFKNILKSLVYIVGGLVILQTLGISIAPILTALGVGGLAVALALQDTLSNLFSGIHIIVSKQVQVGDYVKLDSGEEGYVTDIRWRNTTIRALPNNMYIIPNSKMASTIVTNYYQPEKEMAVLVQVGVSYESDLKKVEKVTVEVGRQTLKEVTGGVGEFEPFIRYHTFADFSINFTVILRVKEFVDQYLIKHEFVKRLHERYNKEGIEIPFPIRTVHLKQDK